MRVRVRNLASSNDTLRRRPVDLDRQAAMLDNAGARHAWRTSSGRSVVLQRKRTRWSRPELHRRARVVRASLEVYLAGMRRSAVAARLRVAGGALMDASLADLGELSRGEPRYTTDQAQLPH